MPPILNDFENRPFPSSKNSHFQNEARYKTFSVKKSFICMRIKIGFLSMTPHLASLWNRGLWQIGNGLLKRKKPRHHVTWEKECVSTSFNCGCHLFGHNAIHCVFICPCHFYVYWFAYQSLSKTKWSIVLMKIFQNQKSKHNLTVQFRHFLIGKFWQEILNQRWSTALT